MHPPSDNLSDRSAFAATYNPPQNQGILTREHQSSAVGASGQQHDAFSEIARSHHPKTSVTHQATVDPSMEETRPTKKASNPRKRYPPPGPAGVWYHSHRHAKHKKGGHSSSAHSLQCDDSTGKQDNNDETKEDNVVEMEDISSCPAWMCMQKDLGLCTPFLPSYYTTLERYDSVREYVPSQYVLLPEIHRGLHDLRLKENKFLIVLVHSVQYHGHVDWTVELRDECGDRIRAWLEPELVEREQEAPHYVRLGDVWRLSNVSMAISAEDGSSSVERMLLVSESNISKMWTPQQASDEVTDGEFLEWMQQRASIRGEEDVDAEEVLAIMQTDHQQEVPVGIPFSVNNGASIENRDISGEAVVVPNQQLQVQPIGGIENNSQGPTPSAGISTASPGTQDEILCIEVSNDDHGIPATANKLPSAQRRHGSTPRMQSVEASSPIRIERRKENELPGRAQHDSTVGQNTKVVALDVPDKETDGGTTREVLVPINPLPQNDSSVVRNDEPREQLVQTGDKSSKNNEISTNQTESLSTTAWVMQDDTMMDFLDDDDDDHKEETVRTVTSEQKNEASSLFQVGALDGVNVDELFDED